MPVATVIFQERDRVFQPDLRGGFKKFGQKNSKEMVFGGNVAKPYF